MGGKKAFNWISRPAPVNNTWISVCFGNNRFVAVSDSGTNRLMTSDNNGDSWTAGSGLSANSWTSVFFANNTYIALGSGHEARHSTNGTSWSNGTNNNTGVSLRYNSIAFGNNRFISTVGRDGSNFSANTAFMIGSTNNGAAWTGWQVPLDYAYDPPTKILGYKGIAYGNNMFIAASGNQLHKSDNNGQNWETSIYFEGEDFEFHDIAFGNGIFVATGYNATTGKNYVLHGPGYMTEKQVSFSAYTVAFGGDYFIFGLSFMSKDLNTFHNATIPSSNVAWVKPCYGNGRFVSVGFSGTGNMVMTLDI